MAVGSGGDDIGAVHHNGLRQGGVGVAGEDDVDALHSLGEFVVLPFACLCAGVGETEDELRPLGLQGFHAPLCRLGHVLQNKAGGGGAVVGVHSHEAEDAVGDAAPLQKHGLLCAVTVHGRQDGVPVRVLRGGDVVGLHQSGEPIPAVRRGVQHPGQPGSGVVKLVVAQGNGVVAQGPHGPQLRGLSGVERLDQRADGEVAAVHQQRVRVLGPLPADGGFQPGIAAGLPAVLRTLGQEVGVEVVGKENGGLKARGERPRLRSGDAENDQQQGQEEGRALFHGASLYMPLSGVS